MKYTVHAYDLNGKHTLLDELNAPILFGSEDEAKQYLLDKGCTEDFIETVSIEEADEEVLKETFVPSTLI